MLKLSVDLQKEENRMKKIALVTPGFLPVPAIQGGAVENLIELIINENEKYKIYDIDLYTIDSKKYSNYNYEYTNIIRININRLRNFTDKVMNKMYSVLKLKKFSSSYSKQVSRMIKKMSYKYDKIIVENNMYLYKEILKKNPNNNYYFHLHNDVYGLDKPVELCELIINSSKKILTVSNYIKERLLSKFSCSNIYTLYNSIDENLFNYKAYNNDEKIALRKKLGLSSDNYVYIYTGRICDEKGVIELIQAFSSLLETNKNLKLLVVGNSWFNKKKKNNFEKKIFELSKKISSNISFTGYVKYSNVPLYLSISDCVVIPSKWEEPFGLVAIEAMAMKKTIISSNSGGLAEILNNKNAIIVTRDNLTKNLEVAMEKTFLDLKNSKKLAERAYIDFIENYDYQKRNYFNNFVQILECDEDD